MIILGLKQGLSPLTLFEVQLSWIRERVRGATRFFGSRLTKFLFLGRLLAMAVLLQLDHLSKAHGPHVLFDDISLAISEEQKIGFIGRNGAGKSSLLRVITKHELADRGGVIEHPGLRLGYLEQQEQYSPEETVLAYLERKSQAPSWTCAKMAHAFELTKEYLHMPMIALSGGYQMRAKLAALFLQEPNLVLLDEPTNYLDLQTQLLLEEVLRNFRGSCLIVSHDREFLKNTCTHTLEIERGKVTFYPRDIEEYLAYKEEVERSQVKQNESVEMQKKHLEAFINRFRAKASKATQAQSKMKMLERLQTIEIASPLKRVKIWIPPVEARKTFAVKSHRLAIGYPGKVIADEVGFEIEQGDKVALLGENGQGKTTLLRTLAGELPSLDGTFTFHSKLRVAHYHQLVHTRLDGRLTVLSYLEGSADGTLPKEAVLKMASHFLFTEDDLEKPLAVLSGGEQARLIFAGILLGRFDVLLLDEPTNHLDFETVEALGNALREWNGTVLFVSHSRTFVHLLATSILEVRGGHVRRYPGTYEEYVYHVAKGLMPVSEEIVEEESLQAEGMSKAQLHEKIRTLKRTARKLEEQMEVANKEKDQLMQAFLLEPMVFSKERNQRLSTLNHVLEFSEDEWLKTQHEIEGWELKLRKQGMV